MEIPSMVKPVITWSAALPLFFAAIIPSGIASSSAIINEKTVTDTVAPRCSPIICVMGSSMKIDFPKSP